MPSPEMQCGPADVDSMTGRLHMKVSLTLFLYNLISQVVLSWLFFFFLKVGVSFRMLFFE